MRCLLSLSRFVAVLAASGVCATGCVTTAANRDEGSAIEASSSPSGGANDDLDGGGSTPEGANGGATGETNHDATSAGETTGGANSSEAPLPAGMCSTTHGKFECKDGVCCDPATGLEWQQVQSAEPLTWEAAGSHCSGLSLQGGDWRLPNIAELMSLTRNCPKQQACPVCDTAATKCLDRACETNTACTQCESTNFNGITTPTFWPDALGPIPGADPFVWSSTLAAGTIEKGAFYIHFSRGSFIHAFLVTGKGLARCVRGAPPTTCLKGM